MPRSDSQPSRQTAVHVRWPGDGAVGDSHDVRRRTPCRKPAQPVAVSHFYSHPRSQGRHPVVPIRGQGASYPRDSRRRSGNLLRAQNAVRRDGRGAGRGLHYPFRRGEPHARGRGRHHRRNRPDGQVRQRGGRPARGVACSVIDPRTASPLDEETILESVKETGRLVVVDEASPRCNLATDIVALVVTKAFSALKAPVNIVAPPHTPVPFSPALEDAYVPSPAKIEAAALAVMG